MARKAWIQWADGRGDSPIEENTNGVIELPLIGPEIAGIRLEPAPAPFPPHGAFKTKELEVFPFGRHTEFGAPPRVMLTVPDDRPEPESTKPKRRKGRAA